MQSPLIIKKIKKNIRPILLVVLLLLVTFGPLGLHQIHAQVSAPAPSSNDGGFIANALKGLVANLLYSMLTFASWILWLAASVLNFVLQFTVIDMAENIKGITGINIAWSTIRDLVNMTFVFILLYVAIGTILGLSGANWKKTLINVVIAAILINFSLFFTKVVIDASNMVTLAFYDSVRKCSPITTTANINSGTAINTSPGGLADCFAQPLGITSAYKITAGSDALKEFNSELSKVVITTVFGTVLFVILAFIFCAVAIMFLVRYVNYIFLLVFSPVGVVGSLIPGLNKYASKWVSALTSQSLFAIVYMILTWVVLKLISSQGGILGTAKGYVAGSGGLSGAVSGDTTSIGLIMNYIIIIIFAAATLIISKQIADQGGSVGQKVVGAGLGFVSFGGRLTGGAIGRKIAKSTTLQSNENSQSFAKRMTARTATSFGRMAATGSWDVRSTLDKVGGFSGLGGIDAGGPVGKGGFEKLREESREFFGATGTKTERERNERVRQAEAKIAIQNGERAVNDPGYKAAVAAVAAGTATLDQKRLVDMAEAMERAINKMTNREVETLVIENRKLLKNPEFAKMLSSQQLEALDKSEKLAEQEKDEIKKLRFAILNALLETTYPTADERNKAFKDNKNHIRGLSKKELEMIDTKLLTDTDFVEQLSDDQMKAINDSDKFVRSQKEAVRSARTAPLFNALTPSSLDVSKAKKIVSGMSAVALSRISSPPPGKPDVLTNPAVFPALNVAKLKLLAINIDDSAKIRDIRTAIINAHRAGAVAMGYNPAEAKQVEILADWLDSPDGKNTFQ